jgi:beta-galactosidase
LWGHWVEGLSDYGSARRDEGLNGSGLLSFDRKIRKDAFFLYRARWNRTLKTLHLADKRWEERPATLQRMHIYASETADSVWMTINEDTMHLEKVAPNIYYSEEFMPARENRVVVHMGSMSDEFRFRSGSELKEPQLMAPLQIGGLPPIN